MDALYDSGLSYNPAVEKERDRFWLAYKFMMWYSDIASVNREMMVNYALAWLRGAITYAPSKLTANLF